MYSTVEAGFETPMETKSRLKVTAGRDPGLPPSSSSDERASTPPPVLSRPAHCTLGMQISNCLSVGMMHDNPTIAFITYTSADHDSLIDLCKEN